MGIGSKGRDSIWAVRLQAWVSLCPLHHRDLPLPRLALSPVLLAVPAGSQWGLLESVLLSWLGVSNTGAGEGDQSQSSIGQSSLMPQKQLAPLDAAAPWNGKTTMSCLERGLERRTAPAVAPLPHDGCVTPGRSSASHSIQWEQ